MKVSAPVAKEFETQPSLLTQGTETNPIFMRVQRALEQCKNALGELAHHPAFSGDAPEFNMGGCGFEALQVARAGANRFAGLHSLKVCRDALAELADHSAFEDEAPEFNEGGVGYEALRVARAAIKQSDGAWMSQPNEPSGERRKVTHWMIQKLEERRNGYDWPTFAIRDSKTNICLAVVGEVDRGAAEHNETHARIMMASPEMKAALLLVHEVFAKETKALVEQGQCHPNSGSVEAIRAVQEALFMAGVDVPGPLL